MVSIDLADPAVIMPAITGLMIENWSETGFDFEFRPSVDMYRMAVESGVMFALAVTLGSEIIGYCTMMIHPHMHNPSVIIAANDALFVKKEYRGIIGARLIRAAEAESKKRGATRVLWHTRAGTPFADMLSRRGYKPADVVVMKEI
ncbi:NAT_SF domain containing protein [uncultured Caudovirales phage]|uniref:NAT_SF domain containing protein n=1 Tax=uncultured Caudovirales phage TaxID=2100421 RepID=A0A6J5P1S3_9CAUD|nr:NAT_SF domain containing protein [uncultured Caudovirales phage]